MTSLMVYLFLVMDGVVGLFITLSCILGFIAVLLTVHFLFEEDKPSKTLISVWCLCFLFISLSAITPNTKQTAMIFGVPYILENTKNMQLEKVPVKIVNYLNAYLDKETEKLVTPKTPK